MAAISDRRQAQMSIDLGGEQLLLEKMRCTEALGRPFTLTVDIIAALGEIDLLPHLGKPVSVHLYEDDELMRHFNGLIADGEFLGESGAGFHYRLTAHPFTYFLSQNRDMAIFQDMSVPDIIQKVFGNAGQTNFQLQLSRSYPPRTYCVQYRESDFAFLTRLMEEEGIYYFYRHSADKHMMVICDAPTAHEAGTPASLRFSITSGSTHAGGSSQRGGHQHTLEQLGERVSSRGESRVTLRAFDFEKPERPLQAQNTEPQQHPGDAREVYDYPSSYVDEGRGAGLSAVRLAALRRERQVYSGRSQATSLACGTTLKVSDHPGDRFNQSYLITRTEHFSATETYRGEKLESEDSQAPHVRFEAIPAHAVFHLPQETPRPVVQGLETAIVSGPAGEEIYTDEYGRVKVRFHWDRADTAGEKSTCWVRVAQFGNLGSLILPRVNQEVMVDFLHGDPDQPIVMGWVFNKGLMPVYDLPANKTRAVWRTKRYGATGMYPDAKPLDTGSPGANELRFEDKGGHEEVFIHAERDMNTRIRFAETHHVGQNQALMVGYDRQVDVGHDETTTVKNNQTLTIKEGDQTEEITKGNRAVTIKKGNDALTLETGNIDTKVKMGNISVKVDLGTIEMEALQSITFKVGQSSVTIDQMGVSIKGMMLKNEAQMQSSTSALMTEVKGGAMTTVKGAIVMIN